MTIGIYRFFTTLLSPLIILYIYIRKWQGKEDVTRFKERFAKTNIARPEGKLIWINAVSVGEIRSAWGLIKKLQAETNYSILVTTTTTTSAGTVSDLLATLTNQDRIIHQFFPIDLSCAVKRFLKHWKPNLLINVESEIWPNVITMTKKVCPVMAVNAKMSKRSFRKWSIHSRLKNSVFDCIDLSLAQTQKDAKRFTLLGVRNVKYLGNIKFFVEPLPIDFGFLQELKDNVEETRSRWLVNCSHEGEEEIILEAHRIIKQKYPDILTIIALRHPKRSAEVQKLMSDLKCVSRSSGVPIGKDTDIFLYDALGNLGTLFEFSPLVFMAGSLQDSIGGHSPIEAAKQQCAIITGPYIENNKSLFRELELNKGCLILDDNKAQTIADTVLELLQSPEKAAELSRNAYQTTLNMASLLNQLVEIVREMVE